MFSDAGSTPAASTILSYIITITYSDKIANLADCVQNCVQHDFYRLFFWWMPHTVFQRQNRLA